jgi:hypothetical protein
MTSTAGGLGSDPLVDALARVLVVPLRELYALLWRGGVVVIVPVPADSTSASPASPGSGVTAEKNRGTIAAPAVATAAALSA